MTFRRVFGLLAAGYLLAFTVLLPGLHNCPPHSHEEGGRHACPAPAAENGAPHGPRAAPADAPCHGEAHACPACSFLSQAPLHACVPARILAPHADPTPTRSSPRGVAPRRQLLRCVLPRGPPRCDSL